VSLVIAIVTVVALGPAINPIRVSTESQIDEKWSEKYKSSIDCNNPNAGPGGTVAGH
jgi:hypothetical protein